MMHMESSHDSFRLGNFCGGLLTTRCILMLFKFRPVYLLDLSSGLSTKQTQFSTTVRINTLIIKHNWLLNPQADNQTFILIIPHCFLFFNDFHGYGCVKWRLKSYGCANLNSIIPLSSIEAVELCPRILSFLRARVFRHRPTYHLDAVNSSWAHRVGRVHNHPHSKTL